MQFDSISVVVISGIASCKTSPSYRTYENERKSQIKDRLVDNIDLRTSLFQYYDKADTSGPG